MAAKFSNPRKKYNWSIQIVPDPINPFMFQKVTLPDTEIDKVNHGDTNHDIKTAGRVSFSDLVAEKLLPAGSSDRYMWSWLESCQSAMLGGGSVPDVYKKTIFVIEYSVDGVTELNRWIANGVWPCKLNGQEFDRNASENSLENIEFSVDTIQKV